MHQEEVSDAHVPCETCGFTKVVLKSGYLYCIECGTRAADSQPLIDYSIEVALGIGSKRKIPKNVTDNALYGGAWTTWHGYNMILVGLTDELASCCSKQQEFRKNTIKLWGMYLKLNGIAFFTTKAPKLPKLSYGMHARDLEYLYNMKRPTKTKQSHYGAYDDATDYEKYKRKRQLITKHFKEVASSQVSSVPTLSQNLADLTQSQDTEVHKISITKNTVNLLRKTQSCKNIEYHKSVGFCKYGCKCLLSRTRTRLRDRPYFISIPGLYAIMILALRICDDEVHLGDVLRWCREEHMSFSTYKHFFPDDMKFKEDDPKFKMRPYKMTHYNIRKTAGLLAQHFGLQGIKAPDISILIRRYIKELELPHDLNNYILRLVRSAGRVKNYYPSKESILPNYEAIAMAYIIILIKMIFGLDGTTENNISSSSEKINNFLSLQRKKKQLDTKDFSTEFKENLTGDNYIFVFKSWMKYIEYRKVCLKYCHYPTKMKLDKNNCNDPELFLHHKNITKKSYMEEYVTKKQSNNIIKSILGEIEQEYRIIEEKYPVFLCSIYPMLSYTENLIPWMEVNSKLNFNRDIIEEDFSMYNISFFFNQKPYVKILTKMDIHLDIFKNRHGFTPIDSSLSLLGRKKPKLSMQSDKDVVIINVQHSKWLDEIKSDKIADILNNTELNDTISRQTHINLKVEKNDETMQEDLANKLESVPLNFCHNNYWIRHYEYLDKKFTSDTFNVELERKFPSSFSWLLKECASTVEMETIDLYKEVCIIEKILMEKNPINKVREQL